MSDLYVVATLTAKPEAVEGLREGLQQLVRATRQEEGCVAYDLFESTSAPGTFFTVERWSSQEALDAHLQTEHVAAAISGAEGNIEGEIGIHPLTPVPGLTA